MIGKKISSLRQKKGLSCIKLAELIDVTPQQLHKYEKGINRLSVGRLVLIAKVLEENVDYFYKELEVDNPLHAMTIQQRLCMEVSGNFMKIRDTKLQGAVNNIIRCLALKKKHIK
ncbi:helix-turn-helix domain-containing protein [Rickettsia endosymbiont of Polydrusus tereticollis]|uniref:helix-turn-helix domain-containing protein n=1 Tax=Rickettsia endosymbiont of Polydrusus tereticollis TaxID=3066251 RepID=UPI00397948D0